MAGPFVTNSLNFPNMATKSSPVGADLIMLADSAANNALKKATITSILGAGSSGALVLIASATATNVAVLNFSNNLSATYDNYRLAFEAVTLPGNLFTMNFQIGTGSTPTYQSSSYSGSYLAGQGGSASNSTTGTTNVGVNQSGMDAASPQGMNGYIDIMGVNDATVYKIFTFLSAFNNNAGNMEIDIGMSQWASGTVLTSIRFQGNGNISRGIFKLYGYQN